MYLKTTFFITFFVLLISQKIYSQAEIREAFLKKQISRNEFNADQINSISSLLKERHYKQKTDFVKQQNIETTEVVESVLYVLANGDRFKESYNYDDDVNITSYQNELWDGTQWTNYVRFMLQYNSDGNRISNFKEVWDSTQWAADFREVREYDLNGNKTCVISEVMDGTQWVTESQENYQYDPNGNLIFAEIDMLFYKFHIFYEYNTNEEIYRVQQVLSMEDVILLNTRSTYFFNSNKNVIKKTTENMINDQWVITEQVTYERDSNFNLVLELSQGWSEEDSLWINSTRYYYEYDQNENNILTFNEKWNNNDSLWVSNNRHTYEYDLNGKMTSDLWENKDSTDWSNYSNYTYEYDEIGNFISGAYNKWIDGSWMPSNGNFAFHDPRDNEQYFYYTGCQIEEVSYNNITGIAEDFPIMSEYYLSQNYPNPFNPSTVIRYGIPSPADYQPSEHVTLRIYDILGNEIATLVDQKQSAGYYEYTWKASEVSSGIYFYVLNTDSFREIKKMILLK